MKKRYALSLLLFMLLIGCNPIKITSSWKADFIENKKYKRILVLGLIHEKDRSIHEHMVFHLAYDLTEIGYIGIPATKKYGPKGFNQSTEQEVIAKIKDDEIDAILTIVLLGKEKERKYVPGRMYSTPFWHYYGNFWGYHSALYGRIYEPGYYITESKFFWESNMYDMPSQKLIYSAQSQSFDISNSEKIGHEYGRVIAQNLEKKDILTRKNLN